MSEYESGRHEGVRRAIETAKTSLASITKRKREATDALEDARECAVDVLATFQYASGMENGAREVLRHLEDLAEDLHVHELRAASMRTREVIHDRGVTLTLGVVHFEPGLAWYWGDNGTCRRCGAQSSDAGQQSKCPTCGYDGH